jgi:hypothetical protein
VRRLLVLTLAPLLLFTAGCPAGPFTAAAGAYAKVGADSFTAVGAAPTLLSRTCVKAADAEYLQSRLSRLKFETEGVALPAGGDYYIPWETWFEKAHPERLTGGSWKAYCGEIDDTSKAFGSAVGALGAYSAALGALASDSVYEGADLGKSVDGVNKTVARVSQSESGPSRAVSSIGGALDKFVAVVLREKVERDIEGYVRLADPEVQRLLVALRAYIVAARVDVEAIQQRQLQVIISFEKLTGLGASASIAPCRVGAPAAPLPAASPEITALRQDVETQRKALVDVCRSLDQLEKTTNAQKLFAFHALARATEEDIRQTRAVLTGFEDVLVQLGVAHTALVKAGQTKASADLKALLGTVAELTTRLGALQAALAEPKK